MQNSKDIQELIYRTIENISKELINKTNYLYLVEGKVTEIDTLGNCYVFKYQDEDYVGFSITGEKYNVGDLIYVLFSNNKNVKKMILSKTKAFSNNDIRRMVTSAQESAEEAKNQAQEALDRIEEIGQDGNTSPNEKLLIKKDWENIKIEYTQITEEMELYGGSENPTLAPLKERYDDNYIILKSYIEPILEDLMQPSQIDPQEFVEKFNNYYFIRQSIAQAIADITKTIADETQELAKISEKLLSDIANDNKLTPSEKQNILKEFQGIEVERGTIIEQAQYYGIVYLNYDKSYNDLKTYLTPFLEEINTTSDIIGETFRQYFVTYYDERQKLQKDISNKAKDIVDDMEIGGRNILKYTDYSKTTGYEVIGNINTAILDSNDNLNNRKSLKIESTGASVFGSEEIRQFMYTTVVDQSNLILSFYAKANEENKMWLDISGGASVESGIRDPEDSKALTINTEWTHYTYFLGKITLLETFNTEDSFLAFGFKNSGTIWINSFKLETGDKATDWTAAPEDIQGNINDGKQEAIEVSKTYVDIKNNEIKTSVENIKTTVDGHTTAISTVQSSVQQTENKVDTIFTQTNEIKDLTDQNTTQLEEYKQYISMEPVIHEGEEEPRPTITLGQSTSSFKVAIDNKEIAFTGASGEKVAYITGDELRINNVVVVRKLAIGDFFLEQEENGHLVLKKGG